MLAPTNPITAGHFAFRRPVTASTSRGTPAAEPFTTTWSAKTEVLDVTTCPISTGGATGASLPHAHRHEAEKNSACVAAVPQANVSL